MNKLLNSAKKFRYCKISLDSRSEHIILNEEMIPREEYDKYRQTAINSLKSVIDSSQNWTAHNLAYRLYFAHQSTNVYYMLSTGKLVVY